MLTVWSHPVRLWSVVLAWAAPVACDYMSPGPKVFSDRWERVTTCLWASFGAKKVELVGGKNDKNPGIELATFEVHGGY